MAYPPRFFKGITHHTENEERYEVGGFHPVHLGDSFESGRYTVFRKIGWATSSTVWLAEDKEAGTYVVLKIFKANCSQPATVETTFTPDPKLASHPGAHNLSTKIDAFRFDGPNGTHQVLVLEVLGRSFEELMQSCDPVGKDDLWAPDIYNTKEWSAIFVRKAARQIALGLQYLHAHGIMHRDPQPGNILLGLTYNINSRTKAQLNHEVWEENEADDRAEPSMDSVTWSAMNERRQIGLMNILERTDGKPLAPNHPRYSISAISVIDKLVMGPSPPTNFTVKLIDLGSACRFEDCNDGTTPYPIDIRAPEVVMRMPYNEKADVFSLACTFYRLATFKPLIQVWQTSSKEDTDDDYICNMIDRLGKLPDDLKSNWTLADKHLDAQGNYLEEQEFRADSSEWGDVWQGVRLAKPKDMSEVEAKTFCDLLVKMLDYDAAKRFSMDEVLEHPWFTTDTFTE